MNKDLKLEGVLLLGVSLFPALLSFADDSYKVNSLHQKTKKNGKEKIRNRN